MATAPTAGAANSQPYPVGPTCRMSCAKMGRSAVAGEKNVGLAAASVQGTLALGPSQAS